MHSGAATDLRIRCSAQGCRRLRRLARVLCDTCWTRVPLDLRRDILRLADRDLDGGGARRLRQLIGRAVLTAEAGIGAKA
jgi:hypothetical protein